MRDGPTKSGSMTTKSTIYDLQPIAKSQAIIKDLRYVVSLITLGMKVLLLALNLTNASTRTQSSHQNFALVILRANKRKATVEVARTTKEIVPP